MWKKICKNKIINQSFLLRKIKNDKSELLMEYSTEITNGDRTNREGHAAKVYFNALFGKDFSRDDNNDINSALNYGYGVLLSTVNKEICSLGYLTQLGIHHKNEFNPFNLTCDVMEPFRPIIDNFVYYNRNRKFDSAYKYDLINIFNDRLRYNGKEYFFKDIIKLYVKDTLDSMSNEKEYKEFLYYEG